MNNRCLPTAICIGLTFLSSVSLADTGVQYDVREKFSASEAYKGARVVMDSRERLPGMFEQAAILARDTVNKARKVVHDAHAAMQGQCIKKEIRGLLKKHVAGQLETLVADSLTTPDQFNMFPELLSAPVDPKDLEIERSNNKSLLLGTHTAHFYLDRATVCQVRFQWEIPTFIEPIPCLSGYRPHCVQQFLILEPKRSVELGDLQGPKLNSIYREIITSKIERRSSSVGECIDLNSMSQKFKLGADGNVLHALKMQSLGLDDADLLAIDHKCGTAERQFWDAFDQIGMGEGSVFVR